MGAIIGTIILVGIIYFLMRETAEGKLVIFFGGVAVLAAIGTLMLPFLKYISYGAILIILVLLAVMLYKKLFS